METLFTVTSNDLVHVDPQRGVDLFRDLLCAEASASGIPINEIRVPGNINARDGGVDATVQSAPRLGGLGIIKQGLTCYQIKTGEFKVSHEDDVNELILNSSGGILPEVKQCLDSRGVFIAVLYKWSDPSPNEAELIEKLRGKLAYIDSSYKDAHIEIFAADKLGSFFCKFPSLALRLKRIQPLNMLVHSSWKKLGEMGHPLQKSDEQEAAIHKVDESLQTDDCAVHIRILGEAGRGKTRVALEATSMDDIKSQVIYYRRASEFISDQLFNTLSLSDNTFHVVLVIDECDHERSYRIWDHLKNMGSRVRLITIYNEFEVDTSDVKRVQVKGVEDNTITEIFHHDYKLEKHYADRWARLCEGYPRFAHLIGQSISKDAKEILNDPNMDRACRRIIAGYDDPQSQVVHQRFTAMKYLALFKRFGYGERFINEARAIHALIAEHDPNITWQRFKEIIQELQEFKVLQGKATLYITPMILQISFWKKYWEVNADDFDYLDFTEVFTADMKKWFNDMFRFARSSPEAMALCEKILGEEGPFADGSLLQDRDGANFFLALAEAHPRATLNRLKKTVGKWDREALLRFDEGRMQVVWALERIAMWRDLFQDAVRLLLILGEAENQNYDNNARGTFIRSFELGAGEMAPTQAEPEIRIVILKEAFQSDSTERRQMAIEACGAAFAGRHHRMVGAEYQGFQKVPDRWLPNTWGDLWNAHRLFWYLLEDSMDTIRDNEKELAISTFFGKSRDMARAYGGVFTEMMILTFRELLELSEDNLQSIISHVAIIVNYDLKDMQPENKEKWLHFRDSLIGDSYHERLVRFVGMNIFHEHYNVEGNRSKRVVENIERLVEKSLEKPELLKKELNWLTTPKGERSNEFGYELGKHDVDRKLLPALLEAHRKEVENLTPFLLCGYFRAIKELDSEYWEELMDSVSLDDKLVSFVPELTFRSGLTERAVDRCITLARNDRIDTTKFHFFAYGSILRDLNEDKIYELIEFLMERGTSLTIAAALEIYSFGLLRSDKPSDIRHKTTYNLITHPKLFEKIEINQFDSMIDYHWNAIVIIFLDRFPEEQIPFIEVLIANLTNEGILNVEIQDSILDILNRLVQSHPAELWNVVSPKLGPPIDMFAYEITSWLKGGFSFKGDGIGALQYIPVEEILKWVDEDLETRAWYLATFVPKQLKNNEGESCIARELLVRYGNREDVRSNLRANYGSEGWTGSTSLHYTHKKEWFEKYRLDEDDLNVILWLDEYIEILKEEIKHAKEREERADY